jgi:hypothetical protein
MQAQHALKKYPWILSNNSVAAAAAVCKFCHVEQQESSVQHAVVALYKTCAHM